ncbi:hypothetical protein Tco_0806108 [Tanacetum coccineum]
MGVSTGSQESKPYFFKDSMAYFDSLPYVQFQYQIVFFNIVKEMTGGLSSGLFENDLMMVYLGQHLLKKLNQLIQRKLEQLLHELEQQLQRLSNQHWVESE